MQVAGYILEDEVTNNTVIYYRQLDKKRKKMGDGGFKVHLCR